MTTVQPSLKAQRRKTIRGTFPSPLNQVALRHVDAIAALDMNIRSLLCEAVLKTDLRFVATIIEVISKKDGQIQTVDDIISALPESVRTAKQKVGNQNGIYEEQADIQGIDPASKEYLTTLLSTCYPDMPLESASALARAEVMERALRVVQETRDAIDDAMSDFVIVTLYTLFEEKMNELKELIDGNPAFKKAIQLSRPDWK